MAGVRKVAYVHSEEFIDQCNRLPKYRKRASLVHSLIEAYGLLHMNNISIVEPQPATAEDLALFHSGEYVKCLQNAGCTADDDNSLLEFGIGYDCPAFDGIFECLCMVAGGTLKAVECLKNESHSIAINWSGGWHHAHRDEAAGFCYVNDIVLGVLKLKECFPRILYIDLDLHHGDGVQEAFFYTPSVFTVSFHKYSAGFFPGTGGYFEIGEGKGKHHNLNIPLLDGMDDKLFTQLVKNVIDEVKSCFKPSAIVCQCGVDCLAHDPMNIFNLTSDGLGECVQYLASMNLPLLLLGGGGYNFPNAARCWTYLTAMVLGKSLSNDIPEHVNFVKYGPDYNLKISPHNFRENKNTVRYMKGLLSVLKVRYTEDVRTCEEHQ